MNRNDKIGLLLLHALPVDGRMWKDQLRIIPEKTYAPDLYAFGDDIKQWARKCLKRTATTRFVVVGCSVGGSCALEILRLAPERVAATVLIGTKAHCRPNPLSLAETCAFIESNGVSAAWEQYWKPLFQVGETAKAVNAAKAIALAQSREALIRGLRAFHNRPSREDVVANCSSPIHIVTGDKDHLPGLKYSARLAALNPTARLHVIEDCGHYVPLSRPEKMNSLIGSVLSAARKQR